MSLVAAVDGYQQRHRWVGFPLAVVYKFVDDQGGYLAALLTYYGFLSLFPLLLLLVTVLGSPGRPRVGSPAGRVQPRCVVYTARLSTSGPARLPTFRREDIGGDGKVERTQRAVALPGAARGSRPAGRGVPGLPRPGRARQRTETHSASTRLAPGGVHPRERAQGAAHHRDDQGLHPPPLGQQRSGHASQRLRSPRLTRPARRRPAERSRRLCRLQRAPGMGEQRLSSLA